MNRKKAGLSRRDVVKVGAASALAGIALPQVHAGEANTIKLALVGCGGRGTGAAGNALSTTSGPIRLVAMADVFRNRLEASHAGLAPRHGAKMDVPEDNRHIGFDGYKHAMDALNPGDIVILTTPAAFRWLHFKYALDRNLNVFMEKPVSVDGASTKKFLEQVERSETKGTKVGVGLMCRHCNARRELWDRVQGGAIGDILTMRAYRQAGPTATAFSLPKPPDITELAYQIQRFHSFLWLSGGCYSDFLIHNIDECCWMKNAWPISAKGSGGRHYRGNNIDQNFDTYSIEYTFADGAKLHLEGRVMQGCEQEFASYIHGSRGSATVSTSGHTPARPRIYRGQNMTRDNIVWQWAPRPEPDPYQLEWDRLVLAVRNNLPHNETRRGAEASLITAMGRLAAHTGRAWTRDDTLNLDHDFAPNLEQVTSLGSPSPLRAGADGKYPVPRPGEETHREF
jgi:predicted dehydrogenase